MKRIHVENYKNLDKLDVLLEEGKINFLYGISGTGKTSIVDALSGKKGKEFIKYGAKAKDMVVNSDFIGKNIGYFGIDHLSKVLIKGKNKAGFFDIVYDESDNIKELKSDLETNSEALRGFSEKINQYILQWETFIAKNPIDKKKKDELTTKASLIVYENEVKDIKEQFNDKDFKEGQIKWIKDGVSKFKDDTKCWNCFQKLNQDQLDFFDSISDLSHLSFDDVFNKQIDFLKSIDASPEDIFTDKEALVKKILERNEVIKELKVITEYINYFSLNEALNLDEISISKQTINLFPDLENAVKEFNDNIKKYNITLKQLKANINGALRKGVNNKFNRYLNMLGVGYKFDYDTSDYDLENEELSYTLVPINSDIKINVEKNLSFGEKNIISFLLFMFLTDYDVYVFDDPISSFDEQRRAVVLQLILDKLPTKTVIILSHDQVMSKLIVNIREKNERFRENIGNIYHLSNDLGNPLLSNISFDDYKPLKFHALDRYEHELDYFSKIVILRLILEVDKKHPKSKYKEMYEYVSGIYHLLEFINDSKKYNELEASVIREEEDVLLKIKNEYEIELPKYQKDKLISVDVDSLCNVEKLFFFRMIGYVNELAQKEFDSWVHLNDAEILTLNPFKYDTFTDSIRLSIVRATEAYKKR